MRFYFPNLSRPKKAAKRLVELKPPMLLSSSQQAIARTLGYRDWHDLELGHLSGPPTPLDEELTQNDFRSRFVELTFAFAAFLHIPDGDAQFLLSRLRLTGNRALSYQDHEAIRTNCWRREVMPWLGIRQPGTAFYISAEGERKRRAYLRKFSGAVRCVTDRSTDSCCADFEAVFPRTRIEDFIPRRLVVPYGWWTLNDSIKILFSRDYKPLWVITPDGQFGRIEPWLWIKDIKNEEWFGGSKYAETTWNAEFCTEKWEMRLKAFGITGLPMLADALPVLIRNKHLDIRDAVADMKKMSAATPTETSC